MGGFNHIPMPYLSQLLNSKVTDSSDKVIGRLKEILVRPNSGEYSPLEFLKIKVSGQKEPVYIPYEYVENFSKEEISLKTLFKKVPNQKELSGNIIGLVYEVLDQQIVDVSGARVVRVNDLRIGDFEGKMSVLGIDISTKGLLRRLGFGLANLFPFLNVHLIDWREAHLVRGLLKLETAAKKLNKLHPADLANIIEDLSVKHGSKLVSSLSAEAAAKVLEEVDPNLQKILVKYLGPVKAADILAKMSIEEIVDLMKTLPTREAQQFLARLNKTRLDKIERLIHYDNDTAGGLMMIDCFTARPDWTVKKVIEKIEKAPDRSILYVYVTDEDGTFHGSVSLRWLLISSSDKKIGDLIKALPPNSTLKPNNGVNEVINLMTKYDLYTAAVLDDNNKLVGIVGIDDVMRHLVPDA